MLPAVNGRPGPEPPARAGGRRLRGIDRLRGTSRVTKIAGISAALAIVVLAAVTLTGTGGGGSRTPPAASNFSLPALGHPGQRVSLAAFAGRPVIINFFASWCTPCQRETPMLASFYRRSGGHVMIIGVDSNDQTAHAMRFMRSAGVSYPVGADPFPASTTTGYGVIALPQTFFLNARHRIVKRIFGAVTATELSEGVALMNGHQGKAPAASPGSSGE